MSVFDVLILTESAPFVEHAPATGLAVRHTRMAEALSGQGVAVTYAWPESDGNGAPAVGERRAFESLAVRTPADLADWLAGHDPAVVILGYWELAGLLPESADCILVLDYIAPRMLERQFEDGDRLAGEAAALIDLLARCDQVWVGNRRQHDLMLAWLLLAGQDCRHQAPIRIIPIAGPVVGPTVDSGAATDSTASDSDRPLVLFHGGRDWPWRDSTAWISALRRQAGPWRLDDGSEQAGLTGHNRYLERLAAADLVLELSDPNIERRYSQSFRMTDALCAGVPVICNGFLPLAAQIEHYRCGWLVDTPDQLAGLLEGIAKDRAELARRAENARRLARDMLDAGRIYTGLAGELAELAAGHRIGPRRPLLALAGARAEAPTARFGMVKAIRSYLAITVHRWLRKPFQDWLSRRMANRPRPAEGRSCWVVLSRSDIFPTDHGAAVKTERTAWGLSFHVAEVILLTDRRDGYWSYRRGVREYRRFPLLPRLCGWPRAINLIRLMARGVPHSNAPLYLPWVDRGMQFRLMWLLRRYPVEAVQGEFPAYARPAVWSARLFGTRSVMVEHNVEFQRIADQVPDLGEEARLRLKQFEVDLANACDRVITVSERDRRQLIAAGVRRSLVCTIPHGVDLERFEKAGPLDLRRVYSIPADHAVLVFHGIYSYPPNLEAVEELALDLLPRLRAAGVQATVVAMGPKPPERSLPGVRFAGPVDDLAGHLKGGDLAVIPLRQGGGTRMKILDDFAAGVAVVTTSKGMEGIEVEHGRELLVHDDPDAMVRAIADLLGDPARRRALAEAASEWVSRYDWRSIARRTIEAVRG